MLQRWQNEEISNFEYLIFINTIAGMQILILTIKDIRFLVKRTNVISRISLFIILTLGSKITSTTKKIRQGVFKATTVFFQKLDHCLNYFLVQQLLFRMFYMIVKASCFGHLCPITCSLPYLQIYDIHILVLVYFWYHRSHL